MIDCTLADTCQEREIANATDSCQRQRRAGRLGIDSGSAWRGVLPSGLNKFADPEFVRNFRLFVDASPGTQTGLLAPFVHAIVQANIAFFADLTKFIEAEWAADS